MTEHSRPHRWLSLGLLLAIVVIGGWSWARHTSSPPPATRVATTPSTPSRPTPLRADTPSTTTWRDPQLALREGGLRGTRPDGGVNTGFGGRLQPDLALRRLFDYYLSMAGQLDLAGIRLLLEVHLRATYPEAALRAEVLRDFDRYSAYQRALPALADGGGSLPEQFERRHALRQRMLGDGLATAFYANEERTDQITLQRLAIQRDRQLEPAEKARRLTDLDASLPAIERTQRAQEQRATDIQAQTEQLDAAQVDPATRHAARAELWGEQAAAGLELLDQQRDAWQQRLTDYAQRSMAIQTQAGLDSAAREGALRQLRQDGFSEPEQRRLQALEQAGRLPSGKR